MSTYTATATDDQASDADCGPDLISIQDLQLSRAAAQRLRDDPVTSLMKSWAQERKRSLACLGSSDPATAPRIAGSGAFRDNILKNA